MVEIYIHDNDDSVDFRYPHDSGESVTISTLSSIGVLYKRIKDLKEVDELAQERNYSNQDTIIIEMDKNDPKGSDNLLKKLSTFYEEHLHEDEEIRYCIDGSGYFDLKNPQDSRWIRCKVDPGDLLVVPAGLYHRFTLTTDNYIKAKRLFKDEPKWEAHNKSIAADNNPAHITYLKSLK